MLAIKLALEEWRHWLEGSEIPFYNLDRSQKSCLFKECQETQSPTGPLVFVFACFNFSITYKPGSRNVKPNALSR